MHCRVTPRSSTTFTAGLLLVIAALMGLVPIAMPMRAWGVESQIIKPCGGDYSTFDKVSQTATIDLDKIAQESVTLGENACEALTSIVFTGNKDGHVRHFSVQDNAYNMDSALTGLEWPANIETIDVGNMAFNGSSLRGVRFQVGLKRLSIGANSFAQYGSVSAGPALASVDFPQGLEEVSIENNAFYQVPTTAANGTGYDTALKSLSFPNSIRILNIGDYAFKQTATDGGSVALEKVVFPKNAESITIGREAFSQSVNYMSSEAAVSNAALKTVTFPKGIKNLSIGDDAFSQLVWGTDKGAHAALESVTIPSGMDTLTIGDTVFIQEGDGVGEGQTNFARFKQLYFDTEYNKAPARAVSIGGAGGSVGGTLHTGQAIYLWNGDDTTMHAAWGDAYEGYDYPLKGTKKSGESRSSKEVGDKAQANEDTDDAELASDTRLQESDASQTAKRRNWMPYVIASAAAVVISASLIIAWVIRHRHASRHRDDDH